MEDNLLNTYQYNGLSDEHLKYTIETNWLYYNYRVCFARLANYYMKGGNAAYAAKLLKIMDEKIPEYIVPYPSPNHKGLMDELKRRIEEKKSSKRI